MRAEFHAQVSPEFRDLHPLCVGLRADFAGEAARYVLVHRDERPWMRVDLYTSGEECFPFEAVEIWGPFIAIGWGSGFYLIDTVTQQTQTWQLASYFGHLYADPIFLLVASAETLLRIDAAGQCRWQSEVVGLDGVLVHQIDHDLIHGEGEWDPPGGWRPFTLCVDTGRVV